MDGVFLFSEEGPVMLMWPKQPKSGARGRISQWLAEWRSEVTDELTAI